MKAITFLGVRPTDTCYLFPDGRMHVAPYFGVALARFIPDLHMRVLVTEAARPHFEERFLPQVEDFVADVEPVPIPDGRNDDELWSIFQAVVGVVEPKETVIFDITHGFRSLPFLAFLSAAYLRTVKDITLQAVFYGNFEASDRSAEIWRTPVIDLTRFVDLFDWMVAADRFVRFGDARDLAQLLHERHQSIKPDLHTASQADISAWNNSPVKRTANSLTHASQALRVVRPAEAMAASERVCSQLPAALQPSQVLAQPFTLLGQHVLESFTPIALDEQAQRDDPLQTLAVEQRLITWYMERQQIFQAVALAREWLVSWVMAQIGWAGRTLQKEAREQVERALGRQVQLRRGKQVADEGLPDLSAVPELDQVSDLFGELGNLRNDLMHAAKRAGALKARKVEELANKYIQQLMAPPFDR